MCKPMVNVHQAGVSKPGLVPSLSPFGIKLMTYLRMVNIPYQIHTETFRRGPKGKIPWITYKGQSMGDSGLIMEFLNEEFGVDLDSPLSEKERAISRAFIKMLEESTYWGIGYDRWQENYSHLGQLFEVPSAVRLFIFPTFSRNVRKMLHVQGLGRHSTEEIHGIIHKDVWAASEFLGNKRYFMGEEPTAADPTVFGMFAQLLWTTPEHSHLYKLTNEQYPNIKDYCFRMKEQYWPDWDEIVGTKK
ncbi:FAXC [Branchiostoma lanceolatum]|uniref:FAXC protein n=1 Tax=Branchiostoma lanceolatum TaxID=7740 RepID=A0A8K0A5I8_BRALA|nr:FAXC [Branchiostoma lanceolatum]